MARSIDAIKQQVTTAFVNNMAAIGIAVNPDTWSMTNIFGIIIYTIAYCINVLELLFDTVQQETLEDLANLKPHTLKWYANKALAYQHGFDLLPDSDQYDNTAATAEQVAESKVVKYSAVDELENEYGRVYLRVKLAGSDGGDLAPLSMIQVNGVKEYFQRIKDAGIRLQIDSLPPDDIKMKAVCYYDPLILDNTGSRLDGTGGEVVRDAVKNYLFNLPFNGVYVLQYHEDQVQVVPGVVIFRITECFTRYGDLPFTAVNDKTVPDAGYLRFAAGADLEITFIPQSKIK